MDQKTVRPKIKISRTTTDWLIDFVAFAFLVILIVIPVINYGTLPETVPVHFNASGQPDDYGGRNSLWLLPAVGLFMYVLMTVIEQFPQIYNYPVEITEENAESQYRNAIRLIRVLKTVILLVFTFLSYKTIETATGKTSGLGKAFLPVFLLLTFGVIIFYIVKSVNSRDSSHNKFS
jgi:uncharacterized membrane protein